MTKLEFSDSLIKIENVLKSYASFLLGTTDKDLVNDLIQDTYVRALKYYEGFKTGNIQAWAISIMRSQFINQYHKRQKALKNIDGYMEFSSNNPMQAYEILLIKEVNESIEQINPINKTALRMHLDGYKYKEIAEKLNINIGTVKSKIFQAKKELKTLIEA